MNDQSSSVEAVHNRHVEVRENQLVAHTAASFLHVLNKGLDFLFAVFNQVTLDIEVLRKQYLEGH